MQNEINLLGIPLANITMDAGVRLVHDLIERGRPTQVSFVNADCVNLAYQDEKYQEILTRSELNLIDGVGLRIAGRTLGSPVVDNLCGTDLFPRLCAAMQGGERGIYLLGARRGVAERVAAWIDSRYPGCQVSGYHDGYFSPEDEPGVIDDIAQSGAGLLLVAFGAPRQEKWIHRNLHRLNVPVAMGVGGLFDFYSGRIPRAPLWMRRLGLEWCYRLLQEPRRMWRRYLIGNVVFLNRVFRARFRLPQPTLPAKRSQAPAT